MQKKTIFLENLQIYDTILLNLVLNYFVII